MTASPARGLGDKYLSYLLVLRWLQETVRYLTPQSTRPGVPKRARAQHQDGRQASGRRQGPVQDHAHVRPEASLPRVRRGIRSPAGLCDPLTPAHSCAPAAHRMKVPEAAPFTAVLKYAAEEVPRA